MINKINALSIDLEDWYHPEFIRKHIKDIPPKKIIQDSAELLLELFNRYNTKATFFVVGEIAAQNPKLIRKIYGGGHEIASHGFSHKMLHEIGPDGLRRELIEFKKVITDILGDIDIKGFRAPTFSLTQDTNWAVDILKEFKYKYDSSIFPIKISNLYGSNRVPLNIYGLESNDIRMPEPTSSLKEFPVTVFEIFKFRFPITGGFYLRAVPNFLQKKILKLINKKRPFIIYIHPWECYVNTPKIRLNIFLRFISYYNINSVYNKLESLLKNFSFDRIDNILGV